MNKSTGTNWIVDFGAMCHISNDCSLFIELNNLKNPLDIILGDGHILLAMGCETMTLMLKSGSLIRKCKLHDVLCTSELMYNMLSMSKAIEKGLASPLKKVNT